MTRTQSPQPRSGNFDSCTQPPEGPEFASLFDLAEINREQKWVSSPKQWPAWAVYNGDALDVLSKMPDACVHCVVTSPPYFWLRDYGVKGQLGMETSVQQYVTSLTNIMNEARRVLRPDGVAFFNIGDTYYSGRGKSHGQDGKNKKRRFGLRAVDKSGGMGMGIQRKSLLGMPWRLALSFMQTGWILRSSIVWHRKNRLPEHVLDRPSRSYEYVFLLAQARKYHFDKKPLIEGKIEEDMWTIPPQPKSSSGLDTAPFPDELVKRCLETGCPDNGIVMDPFLGSGTTARVANQMGRSAIGIDLNRTFCEYAVSTLRAQDSCS